MDWDPLVALLPLQAPLALQLVALVEDQVRVEPEPLFTEVGLAEMLTVGAGGGGAFTVTVADWLAEPPDPCR